MSNLCTCVERMPDSQEPEMSNEDKMREEYRVFCDWRWNNEYSISSNPWKAWKACAAIKDAEIAKEKADHKFTLDTYRNYIEPRHKKEIEALKLTIKDLQEVLQWYVDTDEVNDCAGNEFWLDGKKKAEKALANSEHHNSRALEKLLLEARIEEIQSCDSVAAVMRGLKLKAKLAELNEE